MTRHRTSKSSVERTSSHGSSTRGRGGRGKQVVFDENVQLRSPTPSAEESELTDLSELENKAITLPASPRRLRSGDKLHGDIVAQAVRDPDATPRQIRSRMRITQEKEPEEDGNESTDDEEEIDELVSSPSPTPPPAQGRRTPVKRRLRPRRPQARTPASDDGGEGDDEEEAELVAEEQDIEEDMEEEVDEDYGDIDDCAIPPECAPRKLRSGKVVGGGDPHDNEEDEEEEPDSEVQEDQDDQEIDLEVESVDLEGDGEEDLDDEGNEVMDDTDCKRSFFLVSALLIVTSS